MMMKKHLDMEQGTPLPPYTSAAPPRAVEAFLAKRHSDRLWCATVLVGICTLVLGVVGGVVIALAIPNNFFHAKPLTPTNDYDNGLDNHGSVYDDSPDGSFVTTPTAPAPTTTTSQQEVLPFDLVERVQAMPYTIHLAASSEHNSCDATANFFPAFTATCPTGIVLLDEQASSSSLTTLTTIDNPCTYLDQQTIFCRDSVQQVQVMCHGETTKDLHLQVSVEEDGSYTCDKQLHYIESSQDNVWWSKAMYGGSATHSVKLSTASCPHDSTHVVLEEHDESNDCAAEYSCNNKDGAGASCRGEAACRMDVAAFDVQVQSLPTGCVQDLVMQVDAGGACDYNVQCKSSVCRNGTCTASKLPDGTSDCEEDNECESGVCASVSMADTNSLQCCPSGASNLQDPVSGKLVCGHQPAGALCFSDSLCQSQVCLFGMCEAGKLAPHEPCERHHQCTTNACARTGPHESLTCCPSSGTGLINGQQVCLF